MTADERYKERLVKIKPLLDELFARLETLQVSGKSAHAKAVWYALHEKPFFYTFLHFSAKRQCAAGQQPGRERDPTVCDRSQELAFQQYSERSKSKRSAVFDRCHSSGKRYGYRAVSDGTVLAACRDD